MTKILRKFLLSQILAYLKIHVIFAIPQYWMTSVCQSFFIKWEILKVDYLGKSSTTWEKVVSE